MDEPQPTADHSAYDRLSRDEAAELVARISELSQANLPLDQGLSAMAQELPGRRLPRVVEDISARLKAGQSLDEALAAQGRRLPGHLRGLVLAGLRSGALGDTLERFIHYQRVASELRRRAWLSLAYPALLIVMLIGLYALFLSFIVAGVADVCRDFGIRLHPSTEALFWLSGEGRWVAWAVLAAPIVAAAAVRLLGGPALARRALAGVPLVGPLWRWTALSEFARLLGLLLERGLALPKALELTADGLGDAWLARACRQLAQDVSSGQALSAACAGRVAFPPTLLPILAWGERSASLPEALFTAGEMFEGRVRVQATFVETVLPPVTFMLVAAVTLFLIFATYSPILGIIEALS